MSKIGMVMADSVVQASAAIRPPAFRLEGITKSFGSTLALRAVDMVAQPGEVIGLVGHNGAGKSTLMRVLTGQSRPDRGEVELGGVTVTGSYGPSRARDLGIRVVHQELSLCANLAVYENLMVRAPGLGIGWRRKSRRHIASALDEVFPGHDVSVTARVGDLSLSQQQMVEIAIAVADIGPSARILVLDEPTSSLDAPTANSLFAYLKSSSAAHLCTLFVSHRLTEVSENADRLVVLRDGEVVHNAKSSGLSRNDLIKLMGDETADENAPVVGREALPQDQRLVHQFALPEHSKRHVPQSVTVSSGELVGLAGLEGQGQREILQSIFGSTRTDRGRATSYVSGDRAGQGVMPLWSVQENISVSALKRLARWGFIRAEAERKMVGEWIRRLDLRGGDNEAIVTLSGGNQQKALIARALAAGSQIVLLDDPTRGVDTATKAQIYELLAEEAAKGRSFIWYSTETDEMRQCDRCYVIRAGRIVDELSNLEFTEERLIGSSFSESDASVVDGTSSRKTARP